MKKETIQSIFVNTIGLSGFGLLVSAAYGCGVVVGHAFTGFVLCLCSVALGLNGRRK